MNDLYNSLLVGMKSLNYSLNEGILDDIDDQMINIDKSVKDNWLNTYAKGDFKIKDKKSSLGCTIVGNLIIDKYEGETIPISIWAVKKGNVYFTNCPNLKTINGFFGERPLSLDGGLYIENCPNLEDLNGLPPIVDNFSLIGNKKIKSLEGAPKHVFGNCYIMKNGKKFSEEYIRSLIEVTDRIDCNEEAEEANITEALTEPHLLKLAEYIKTQKSSFRRLFGDNAGVALDKITSKDVQTFRYPRNIEDGVKEANKIISGKAGGFIVLLNKKDEFTAIIYGKNYISLSAGYGFGRSHVSRSTELLDMCRRSGEIMVFKLTNGFHTWELKSDRRDARYGMIENTDNQNRKIARENVERYKKMAAQIRANKDNDFEEIDRQVEDIIMRVLKASQLSHRNPDKISNYQISSLNKWIYDEKKWDRNNHSEYSKDGLLRIYNNYTEYFQAVRKGNAYSYQIDGLKECKVKLREIIKNIDNELKSLGL